APPGARYPTLDRNGVDIDNETARQASFRDTLLGSSQNKFKSLDMDDFDLQDGDVPTCTIDGVFSISFLDRIHDLIRKSMVVVCLDLSKPLVSKLWIDGKLQRVKKAQHRARMEGAKKICRLGIPSTAYDLKSYGIIMSNNCIRTT
ncbi:hypothetical protein Gorai_005675, partial [Gossypium raimondii]|nr:hypothetical protein [Gossypium raimondii]